MLNILKKHLVKLELHRFKKHIYPHFHENLKQAAQKDMAVVWADYGEELKIMIVLQCTALVFSKIKQEALQVRMIRFEEEMSALDEEMINIIKATKTQASLIGHHALIEALFDLLNKVKFSYGLSLKEMQRIWLEIFSHSNSFFKSNIVMDSGNDSHAWID